MIIKNVKVFTEEKKFVAGAVATEGDKIIKVWLEERAGEAQATGNTQVTGNTQATGNTQVTGNADEVIDGKGCYLLPGMIDLHFHGCKGYDVCDGTQEALEKIAQYEASVGVTAISPATMTLPAEQLEQILENAAQFRDRQDSLQVGGADLVGINMEGPFISKAKKGAQDEKNIIPMDVDICKRFLKASHGLVKFMGIAPEQGDAKPFIEGVKDEVTVSLAHTNADYDTAKAAFEEGASHVVHLYNAMPPFTHRAPGVVGAAAESSHVMAELICDGVHIHPSVVRATFKMFGSERIILISDSMRAAGMEDGRYTLGGLDVEVKGNRAVLVSDGALAGSVTTLPDCVRVAVKQMDIPLEDAIACATINPAKSLGIDDQYGSISEGKKADLLLWDSGLDLKLVIKDGRIL